MEWDHIYRETAHWDESVAFWERLGFAFAQQWGNEPHRAGHLVNDRATVVLAESPDEPGESLFVATQDLEGVSEVLGTPIVDTHWGTRMVSATDPDGRTYNFEPRSETP
jgi:catechol 2,3-dioxygenase-like lactoylglutathione lyase family enzyme